MAKLTLTDAYVELDTSDESDHVKSITFEVSSDMPDATAMSEDWQNAIVGAKSVNLSIDFYADFAASDISADIWTAWDAGTAMDVVIRPTSSAASATNPEFEGSFYVQSFPPLSGSHGDVVMMPVQFALADGDGVSRSTS